MACARLPTTLLLLTLSVWAIPPIMAAPAAQNAVLRGRVTDREGVPISGAFLSISDRQGVSIGTTQSGPDGTYEVSVPKADAHLVWAGKTEGYLFHYIPETRIAENNTADFRLQRGANIVFVAYDSAGNRMKNAEMRRISAERMFLTDMADKSAPGAFTAVHSNVSAWQWDDAWPAAVVVPGSRYKIQLQWEMPQVGKLLFTLDNGGSGYELEQPGDSLDLDLNREIARSSLAALQRHPEASTVTVAIAQSRRDLLAGEAASMSVPPDRTAAIRAYSRSMKASLETREQLVLLQAARNIEKHRKGNVELTIIDRMGAPLPGVVVDFEQTDNDFMFGVHPLGHAGRYEKRFGEMMREAGFNTSYITARWGRIESTPGTFDWGNVDAQQTPLDKRQDGFHLLGTLGLWFAPKDDFSPRYLETADFPTLREAVGRYAFLLAQRYAGVVDVWEVNELNLKESNFYQLDWQQRISLGRTFTGAVKLGNYRAKVMFSSLALGFDSPESRSLPEMLDAGLVADMIGIELYQAGVNTDGTHVIGLSLTAINGLLDKYNALGKPLMVKEFAVPSQYVEGSSWWYRKWDEELQAEYATKIYTIAFSKQTMQGIIWAWGVSDREAYILHGGLLGRGDKPKVAYYALQKLLASWRTKGSQTTNAAGQVAWRGFGGTYRVTALQDGKELLQTTIHVPEQEDSHLSLRVEEGERPWREPR